MLTVPKFSALVQMNREWLAPFGNDLLVLQMIVGTAPGMVSERF